MEKAGSILDYISPRSTSPRKLTLEETDSGVRVIFAVMPIWVYFLPIVMGLTLGIAKISIGIVFARALWHLAHVGRPDPDFVVSTRRIEGEILIGAGISAMYWWTLAAYKWWKYRRWGRMPRVLTANGEGLLFSRLGWWRMREEKWTADEITTIELQPVRGNLNWKRTVADLYIRRRKGRRLHFRLSSTDSQLPGRIAQQLALALNCPMVPQPL